jgi:hypothetical protein
MFEYLPGSAPNPARIRPDVAFVSGPQAEQREVRVTRPDTIPGEGGAYRRGVSCADDGMLRYVWSPDDLAHR